MRTDIARYLLHEAARLVTELRFRKVCPVWVYWDVRELLYGASAPIRDLPIELTEGSGLSQA